MKYHTLLFVVILSICDNAYGKIFDKCEFVRKLQTLGIPRDQLGTWTCIAKYESNFDTQAVNKQTWDYGILQISSLYWCSKSDSPGKGCHATCKQFLNDNIDDDVACARHVYDETKKMSGDGFSAWTTYNQHCRGDTSQWASNCL
ncbi:hypothetical protein HHI36_010757 [Cryptolaemus montrouzieri]|uniref:lysozyme n=2 Tax=Cryptolaemus montrouzieri TaxID=559131 RepID=A0ABD2MJR1_9CUCU